MTWIRYNPNPAGRTVGDCAVRALTVALDVDWEEAYELIARAGFAMADMPSSDGVINALLRAEGFIRETVPNTCPDCYTVEDFALDHPVGVYVVKTNGHVVGIRSGIVYDSWNSGKEIVIYYWYKK